MAVEVSLGLSHLARIAATMPSVAHKRRTCAPITGIIGQNTNVPIKCPHQRGESIGPMLADGRELHW